MSIEGPSGCQHPVHSSKAGTPGRTFACNLRVRSAALYTLSYGSMRNRTRKECAMVELPHRPPSCQDGALLLSCWRKMKFQPGQAYDRNWTRDPDLHWVNRICRPVARLICLSRGRDGGNWGDQPGLHRYHSVHRAGCGLLHHGLHWKFLPGMAPVCVRSGEPPRCCPVLCGLKARCITGNACGSLEEGRRKGKNGGGKWRCSTTREVSRIHPVSNRWRRACPLWPP